MSAWSGGSGGSGGSVVESPTITVGYNTFGETTHVRDNMIEQTDPAVGIGSPGVWTFEYDDHVNLSRQVDPTGAEKLFTFDARNRLRSATDVVRTVTVTPQSGAAGPQTPQNVSGDSYTTWFTYDDLGRQTNVTSPEGVSVDTDYNETNDAVAVTDADAQTTTSSVDVYGNPVRVTDPLGRQARIEYDSAGRAIASGSYADNSASSAITRTETGYDADGNVTSATSGRGGGIRDLRTVHILRAILRPEDTARACSREPVRKIWRQILCDVFG